MKKTLEWRSGGQDKTWTVIKQQGESVGQFMARAESEFEAQLALYPPD